MEIKQDLWEKDQKQEEERVSAPEPTNRDSEAVQEDGVWARAAVPGEPVKARGADEVPVGAWAAEGADEDSHSQR